jgi:hypothetical protein
MERFGGGVHLESEEGSYTRVTVLLPAKSAPRDRRENREPSDVESINTTG